MSEIVQIGDAGPLFEVRDPWTSEALKAAVRTEGLPWRCRKGKHDPTEIVGDVHIPESEGDTLFASVFALLASSDTVSLNRCKRCGALLHECRF